MVAAALRGRGCRGGPCCNWTIYWLPIIRWPLTQPAGLGPHAGKLAHQLGLLLHMASHPRRGCRNTYCPCRKRRGRWPPVQRTGDQQTRSPRPNSLVPNAGTSLPGSILGHFSPAKTRTSSRPGWERNTFMFGLLVPAIASQNLLRETTFDLKLDFLCICWHLLSFQNAQYSFIEK